MTEKSTPSPPVALWRPAHCARRHVRASDRAEPGTWRVVDEKTLRPAGSVHASNPPEAGSWRVGGAGCSQRGIFASREQQRVSG